MPHTAPNGIDIYYELHGESGPALVLVHGFTGDISDWRFQIAEFAPTHRVLVLDNRGHGRSGVPSDTSLITIDHLADDVEALTRQIGFERYHLVGHSMGGAVAQEIALRNPDALLSLTLHDTANHFGALRLEAPSHRPKLPPERLAEVMQRLASMSPAVLMAGWNALMSWPGTEQRAAQIRTPTLILYGEHDGVRIVEGSQQLAATIPDTRLAVIAAAGHSPQEEQPTAYNTVLRQFLDSRC